MKLCEIHVAIESCCENHLSLSNSWMGYSHSIRNAKVFPALNCSICKMPSNRWVEGMDIYRRKPFCPFRGHVSLLRSSAVITFFDPNVWEICVSTSWLPIFRGNLFFCHLTSSYFLKISSWLSSLSIWFYGPFYVRPFWRGCQVVPWRTGGRAVLRLQPAEWMGNIGKPSPQENSKNIKLIKTCQKDTKFESIEWYFFTSKHMRKLDIFESLKIFVTSLEFVIF